MLYSSFLLTTCHRRYIAFTRNYSQLAAAAASLLVNSDWRHIDCPGYDL